MCGFLYELLNDVRIIIGTRKVVSKTISMEIPSIPTWKLIPRAVIQL
jgi:hypothetical protein